MKKTLKICCFVSLMVGGLSLLTSFLTPKGLVKPYSFPYKQAGLTERQAAEHLISRFTYGATPGQIDAVMKMGLENWFSQQLNTEQPDDSLNKRLSGYEALNLSNTGACREYPLTTVVRAMAILDTVISADSVDKAINRKAYDAELQAYMDKKGFKAQQELRKQFVDQNILRAVYTNNQLQEVLTDFWFNHFNVSYCKYECTEFIPAYERDVIRPNALGKFDHLLLATAKSPAMLYYLDNFTSVGPVVAAHPKSPTKLANGLNENYAREVMELHTLGVDGGYTQEDVTQTARVLTGWTAYPINPLSQGFGREMKGLVDKIGENNLASKGFVHDGDFLFTPNRHDQGEKVVLGHRFPASTDSSAGYQEGVDLLEMLAHNSSTAQFICKKLAVRFVCDTPPKSLIDKMAKSFMEYDGDIKQVLITMVSSPEFWDKKTLLAKTKSPFELAISSMRSLNADVKDPYQLFDWISRMGEIIYECQAPTGYPDQGKYWINSSSLLNRMDFSLALTSGQIAGVNIELNTFMPDRASQNLQNTIIAYSKLLLPEQNPDQTVSQLMPILSDSSFVAQMNKPIQPLKTTPVQTPTMMEAFVAGIIIGSPEFQKH